MIRSYSNTLADIAAIVDGELTCGPECEITSICTDSRVSDAGSLFIPIKGENFDGHNFVKSLCDEKRLAAYLSQEGELCDSVPSVICENTLYALGAIAANYRTGFDIPFVGITGTNGKTTTKELVSAVLGASFDVHKNVKNYNNEIGVPFTLLELAKSHTLAVIEMGMNHAGEISRLSSMVRPDVALITNADAGHLEFLGTVGNVARAKAEIFESMKSGSHVFINRDTLTYDILEAAAKERELVVHSYGFSSEAEYRIESFDLRSDSLSVTLGGGAYTAPLYGIHNVSNLAAALVIGLHFGLDKERIQAALDTFENVGMRSQVQTRGDLVLVNDSYNANPLSLATALESLVHTFKDKRKIAILGDMKELGDEAPAFHYQAGRKVFEEGFNLLLCCGELAREIVHGAIDAGMSDTEALWFATREELEIYIRKVLKKDDVVLVKGSRSMKMEEVAESILR